MIYSEKQKIASEIPAAQPSESKDKRLIQKIQHELNLIGISPKVIGYRYLTDAILATINEPKTGIFKVLGEKYKKQMPVSNVPCRMLSTVHGGLPILMIC